MKNITNLHCSIVIETWGYHIGATIANAAYGARSFDWYVIQGDGTTAGTLFFFTNTNTGQSAYIQALEGYNPNFATDLSRWIPVGVINDLVDTNNETSNPITDIDVVGLLKVSYLTLLTIIFQ